MFCVIVGHLITQVDVIGPFEHEEQARAWAQANVKGLWKVAPLKQPAQH